MPLDIVVMQICRHADNLVHKLTVKHYHHLRRTIMVFMADALQREACLLYDGLAELVSNGLARLVLQALVVAAPVADRIGVHANSGMALRGPF